MLKGYKRHLVLSYLSNIASKIRPYQNDAHRFFRSLIEIADELNVRLVVTNEALQRACDDDVRLSDADWTHVCNLIDNFREKPVSRDTLAERIRELAKQMKFAKSDAAILELLLYYETDPIVEHLVDEMLDYRRPHGSRYSRFSVLNPDLADLLGVTKGQIRELLTVDSPLVQTGIVSVDEDGELEVLSRLKCLAYEPTNSTRQIQQMLFEEAPSSELEWQDFDHVSSGRDHIEQLIVGALKTGVKGVNILIHGPPGTGKTEFCRTLAQRLGINLFSVGESDEHGREPSRSERLRELRLAERLLGQSHNSILLFDEMEDLLSESDLDLGWQLTGFHRQTRTRGTGGSRVFMHRLLEQNSVPTLWTSNSARQTNPTLLRRMMYAFELRQPSSRIRSRIWRRQLARHGVPSADEDAETLANDFDVTPGVVDRAVAAARLVEGGDISTVHKGVESLSRVIHGPKPPKTKLANFDPTLVCANSDPVELVDRLAGLESRRFSVSLQGPPGTGKSAFVRYLAERVGLEVMQKRASDLLSMWVGGTEANIADAFAEARDKEQFLVFDEADSLLADRRFAHRNWEVSQVNEMLTWMETHPFPFACTTNYDERLDPATLRRFDFKLRLDYLSREKLRTAFMVFFGVIPPSEIESLTNLTPGDFAVVQRRAEVLGKMKDVKAIVLMLKEESEVKPEQASPMGFRDNDT